KSSNQAGAPNTVLPPFWCPAPRRIPGVALRTNQVRGGRAQLPASFTSLEELLQEHWIRTHYEAGYLANLPTTGGRLLGVDAAWRAKPLELHVNTEGVNRVVLLLVDGVGYLKLKELISRADPGLMDLLGSYGGTPSGELPAPITSVSPSTTTAATTVIQADG